MSKKNSKTTKYFVKDDRDEDDECEKNVKFSECLIPYSPNTSSTFSTLSVKQKESIKRPNKPLPPIPTEVEVLADDKGKEELDSVKDNKDNITPQPEYNLEEMRESISSMNKQIIIDSGRDDRQCDVYFREFEKYQAKFPNTKIALMFQMGEFCEFFGVDNETEKIGNIREICEAANLQVTKIGKKRNPDLNDHDRENPLWGGFQINSYDDFVPRIIRNGFTLIEVEQTGKTVVTYNGKGSGKKEVKERALKRIISPSTYIDNPESTTTSLYTVSIYIAINTKESKKDVIRLKGWKEGLFSIGMSALDWSTNGDESIVYEAHDKPYDETYAMNELYRFLHSFNPKEVIITYKSLFEFDEIEGLTEASFQDFLRKELELNNFKTPVFSQVNKQFIDIKYQNELLNIVYPNTKMLAAIDYLDLSMKIHACTSFVQILQFAYDRDPRILKNLGKPHSWLSDKHLVLSSNSMYQLHLLHTNTTADSLGYQPGLLDIIDKTKTPIGTRMLKYDIMNPIIDVDQLNTRYDIIDMLQAQFDKPKDTKTTSTSTTTSTVKESEKVFIFTELRKFLSNVFDIERMNRQLEIYDIRPNVLTKMYQSYLEVVKLIDWMKSRSELSELWNVESEFIITDENIKQIKSFLAYFGKVVDVNKMQQYTNINRVEQSLFKKGSGYPEIDKLQDQINQSVCSSESFTRVLSDLIDTNAKNCTIEIKKLKTNSKTKKSHFALNCSKARFKLIEHYMRIIKSQSNDSSGSSRDSRDSRDSGDSGDSREDSNENNELSLSENLKIFKYDGLKGFNKAMKNISDEEVDAKVVKEGDPILTQIEIKYLKSICNINREKLKDKVQFESNIIHESKDESADLHAMMNELMKAAYKNFIENLNKYITHFHSISRFVGRIDVLSNHAFIAKEYIYTKPKITSTPENNTNNTTTIVEGSFINAKQIRHPIIERLLTRTSFVPNDVTLGFNNTNGIILFGINNVGKTSYIRSVGLCVILAQIGSFVPAEQFNYFPFRNILTRLSGHDNMYKGQGSFEVEMSELRDISYRCNKMSLVLADELCHGTEQGTANGIVTGGVLYLAKRTNFILTTHLHDTPDQPELAGLSNVKYMHLHSTRDPVTNKMIYNRTLQEGPGDANYGIEVARANDVQEEILRIAEAVRKRYSGEETNIVSTRKSKYSSQRFMINCLVCGNSSEETHHIREQQTANELGHIGSIHKNHLSNLLPLCSACHNEVTQGRLEILPPIMTSEGVEIPWRKIAENDKSKQTTLLDYVTTHI